MVLQLVRIEKSQAPSSKCSVQNCKWSIYIRDEKMDRKKRQEKRIKTTGQELEELKNSN